jgi:hypothetical protein
MSTLQRYASGRVLHLNTAAQRRARTGDITV